MIRVQGLIKNFGSLQVLRGVDTEIAKGEVISIIGPSGCGKSTFLRCLNRLEEPSGGHILVNDKDILAPGADIAKVRQTMNMVFQGFNLFAHLTALENLTLAPMRLRGLSRADAEARGMELLRLVGLAERANYFPSELSGGQKQRVALARSLVNRPRLLLLDEPLGALDAKLREQMRVELIRLQRDVGITFVFVTHAQTEALALSHRIAVMNLGRVEQIDSPEGIYARPVNRFVAEFVGTCNLLAATVREAGAAHLALDLGPLGEIAAPPIPGLPAGHPGTLALRPEQIRLAPRGHAERLRNQFEATVQEAIYLGDVTHYTVALASGHRLQALAPNSGTPRAQLFRVGDDVTVAWRHDAGHFIRD